MKRKVYRVTAERDGRFWFLRVPDIGKATQARRLDQADYMARELIALWTDRPAESFDLVIEPVLEEPLASVVADARAARDRATAAQTEASAAIRSAATTITGSGLTVRDAGELLGMTYQRVSQLLDRPHA